MALPELERTAEGWEMQFATNFMGHFALTVGLHDALAAAGGARVVSVSSSGNLFSPVVFDDLHFAFRPYDPLLAYGQSKSAEALLAVEATRRWAGEGIYSNALNPGASPPAAEAHRRAQVPEGDAQDPAAGRRDLGAARRVPAARRRRRSLLRGRPRPRSSPSGPPTTPAWRRTRSTRATPSGSG